MTNAQLMEAIDPNLCFGSRRENFNQLRTVEGRRSKKWDFQPERPRLADQENLVALRIEFLINELQGFPGRHIGLLEYGARTGTGEALRSGNNAVECNDSDDKGS